MAESDPVESTNSTSNLPAANLKADAESEAVVDVDEDDEFEYDEQLIQKIYTETTATSHESTENVKIATSEEGNIVSIIVTPEETPGDSPRNTEILTGNKNTSTGILEHDLASPAPINLGNPNSCAQEEKLETLLSSLNTLVLEETSNDSTNHIGDEKSIKYEVVNTGDNVVIGDEEEVKDDRIEIEREEYEKAANEWDDLEEIQPQEQGSTSSSPTEKLTFQEALQHFDAVDMKAYENKINPAVKRSRVASVFQSVIGQRLSKSLVAERNLMFTLALIQFENSDQTHLRILQTIFKTLTRRKIDCARFGSHWELIGFQGNDPATDLRGCGMLSLLNILRFITSTTTQALSTNVYQLSRDEIQNFPFCVMSINITRISLQILREGKLNKECNHRMKNKSQKYRNEFDNIVFDVFQDLYVAIFNKIYTIWKNEGKTMAESGFVVKDVEDYAKSKPMVLLKQFGKRQNSRNKQSSRDGKENDDKIESFVGIDEL